MNVMQELGTDLTYRKVPGALRSYKTFFNLHLCLAKNSKVPGAQLKVNPARAITWFLGVTI